MNKLTTRTIAIGAALAALSATVQLIHVGYQSPQWGMWIDVVSVSWIIAFFLFGVKLSLLVSLIGAVIITLFAPDTWLGASMKFVATVPVILGLFFGTLTEKQRQSYTTFYARPLRLIFPLLVGMLVRCLVVLPLNYYYAIPIWTGMAPDVAMKAIPWFIIAGFNIVQSLIDVIVAWVIVYRFKLDRFSRGQTE